MSTLLALTLSAAAAQWVAPQPERPATPDALERAWSGGDPHLDPHLHGRQLMEVFECSRCHDGTSLQSPPQSKHCVHCHQAIIGGTFDAPKETLDEWQRHLVNLREVPSLASIERLFRREWIASFLLEPHRLNLRPRAPSTMPRFEISEQQAAAIAAYLAPDPLPQPTRLGDAARGKRLMDTKGCGTCHYFTGAPPIEPSAIPVTWPGDKLASGMTYAPDLRYTRDRMRPEALVAWLARPQDFKPETSMPDVGLREQEARDLAAYLLETPLEAPPKKAVPQRLPLLERKVSWDDVAKAVFMKTCWHCHSEPDYARGDGGPGMTGGFGFEGRRLSFADYTGIQSGSVGPDGRRRSIFKKIKMSEDDPGTPRVVAHLLARQIEEAGGEVPGIRGMPLGLPAVTPEEIQLIETWIAQGRPR